MIEKSVSAVPYNSGKSHLHSVIVQSLMQWLLTAEAQSSPCGICGGQSGNSTVFRPCKHISFPVIILPCSTGLLICLSFDIYLFTKFGFPVDL